MPAPRLLSVNLARVRVDTAHPENLTGIDKRPASGPVATEVDQLAGDAICDRPDHGGADQAVYAYAAEDAAFWSSRLDREIGFGAFGENLTTEGLPVTDAVLGERWSIGSALFEVTAPRIPCRTFAAFWKVPDLVRQFTAEGRPGAYLRIVSPGVVRSGDEVTVVHRPAHAVTIATAFRALTGAHELAAEVLAAPELAARYRGRLERFAADQPRSAQPAG